MGKNACMAPDDPKPDVMSSLPRTRPQRRSAKRDAPVKKAAPAKKAAPRAKAAAPRAKKAAPRAKTTAAKIPPAGFAPPRDTEARPVPGGVELVGTAIQAAGELVQIGAAVGRQALAGALRRARR